MTTIFHHQLDKDINQNKDLSINNPQFSLNKAKGFERNILEEKKVKIISNTSSFSFNLNVYNQSIFDNQFLLISTNTNSNTEMVYKWKRIKDKTIIPLKDINTRKYILTSEDIGYTIDVEVMLKRNLNEIAHAQYGEIEFNKEMKDIMMLLLSKELVKFNVFLYSKDDKPNQTNTKNLKIIYYNPNELLLCDICNTSSKQEKEIERSKYIPFNTTITLNQFDPLRFSITFYTYEYEDTQSSTIKLKSQREYDLIASSKQTREVIYLLFKFHSIEEELKNNKLCSLVNYNSKQAQDKDGLMDLIAELSITKEENKMMIGNIKYLEYINNKITKTLKRLEEDYQITLEAFNAIDCYHSVSVNDDIKPRSKNNASNELKSEPLSHSFALKAQCENLLQENKALIDKIKVNNEETNKYIIKEKHYVNTINKKDIEIEHIRDKCIELKNQNTQLVQDNNQLLNEIKRMTNEKAQLNDVINSKIKTEKGELEALKNKLLEIITTKTNIEKEYKALKQEKESIESDYINLNEQCKSFLLSIDSKDLIVNQLSSEFTTVKTENGTLKNEIDKLREELNNNQLSNDNYSKNIKSELIQLTNERNSLSKMVDEMEIQAKSKANDNRLIRLSLQTKDEKMKEMDKKLIIAYEDNQTLIQQYNEIDKEYKKLQELYERIKDNKQDLNYSQNSFIDIKRSEMFEELNQLRREKDETEAYILKLKFNHEKQLLEIEKLKQMVLTYKS